MHKNFIGLRNVFRRVDITTESFIFRLFTHHTGFFLIGLSVLSRALQLLEDPIYCVNDEVSEKALNMFCWLSSTYTIPDEPGEKKYFAFYQWVSVVLLFQSALCFVPKWIWDIIEGRKIEKFIQKLSDHLNIMQQGDSLSMEEIVKQILLLPLNELKRYAYYSFMLECLCLVNIIAQFFFMDRFMGGEFLSYGPRVLQTPNATVTSFPLITICTYIAYNPSGSKNEYRGMCILNQNLINRYIYFALWFSYMALWVIFSIVIVYRIILLKNRNFRLFRFRQLYISVPRSAIDNVSDKLDFGGYWLFNTVGKHLDNYQFVSILTEVARERHANVESTISSEVHE